jgi:hypothetical protein
LRNRFLQKPFALEQFAIKMREMLDSEKTAACASSS